ncbi:unnamed protein product, partial [Closterium sp. NIES-54]
MSREGWRNLENTVGGSARESTDRRNGDDDDDSGGGQAVLVRGGRPIAKSMPHAGQPILSFNTGHAARGPGNCQEHAAHGAAAPSQLQLWRVGARPSLGAMKREIWILYHLVSWLAGSGQRAAGSGQRAAGSGQRAAGDGEG